jgi:hypothetical protein
VEPFQLLCLQLKTPDDAEVPEENEILIHRVPAQIVDVIVLAIEIEELYVVGVLARQEVEERAVD